MFLASGVLPPDPLTKGSAPGCPLQVRTQRSPWAPPTFMTKFTPMLMSLTIDRDYINNIHVLGRKINSSHELSNSIPHLSCSVQTMECCYRSYPLIQYTLVSTKVNWWILCITVHVNQVVCANVRVLVLIMLTVNAFLVDYELLLAATYRCGKCCSLRKRLLMRNKWENPVSPSKLASCHKPNALLTTPMKLSKLAQYAMMRWRLNRKVTVLKTKVKIYQKQCVKLIKTEEKFRYSSQLWLVASYAGM